MTAYELGDRVTFTHQLKRREYVNPERRRQDAEYDARKAWEPEHAPFGRFGGVIVGRRTLANGTVLWGGAYHFTATDRFRAYLVSWHLDKRPVWVLPEHLEPAPPHPVQEPVDEPDEPFSVACGARSPGVIGRCGRDLGHTGFHRSTGATFDAGWDQ